MNRQRLVLTVLAGLFLCSLIYAFLRMPRQERVTTLTYRPGMTAKTLRGGHPKEAEGVRVRLDLLDARKGRTFAGSKNIFLGVGGQPQRKIPVPLPPPPPPPVRLPPPEPPAAVASIPAVPEPTPLQREMANFTFLGFLKKDNRKTVFLSDGKEIFLVRKGDKIAGKYDVTAVTDETLTISSLSGGGEIVIPLVENQQLQAPRR